MPPTNPFADQIGLEARHGEVSSTTRELHDGMEAAPWLKWAFAEIGQAEKPGAASNPRIVEYLSTCGYTQLVSPDVNLAKESTSWCSAFVNWCMEKAGWPGTKNTLAKSWTFWALGQQITTPRMGAIVVMNASGDTDLGSTTLNGHVCFYWRSIGGKDHYLGGNQGDKVSIQTLSNTVLAYYWPRKLI